MSKLVGTTIEVGEQPGVFHIPGVMSQGGAATLCGWVDIPNQEHCALEHPVTCPTCLGILREVKALQLGQNHRRM